MAEKTWRGRQRNQECHDRDQFRCGTPAVPLSGSAQGWCEGWGRDTAFTNPSCPRLQATCSLPATLGEKYWVPTPSWVLGAGSAAEKQSALGPVTNWASRAQAPPNPGPTAAKGLSHSRNQASKCGFVPGRHTAAPAPSTYWLFYGCDAAQLLASALHTVGALWWVTASCFACPSRSLCGASGSPCWRTR